MSDSSYLTSGFIALTWINHQSHEPSSFRCWEKARRQTSAPRMQICSFYSHTHGQKLAKAFNQKHSIAKFTPSSLEEMKQYTGYSYWVSADEKAASQTRPLCWGLQLAQPRQEPGCRRWACGREQARKPPQVAPGTQPRWEEVTQVSADNFWPITETKFKMHSSNLINSPARNVLLESLQAPGCKDPFGVLK